MIQGFFNTVQKDFVTLWKNNDLVKQGKTKTTDAQNKAVQHAGIRTLAALGMVLAGVIAVGSIGLCSISPIGLLAAFLVYAVCHDIFIREINKENPPLLGLGSVNQGTFFPKVWDYCFKK